MSQEKFHIISWLIRFDDRETRPSWRERDKLAAIRDLWDKWEEILPRLYNPGPHITVDEYLVPFRGWSSYAWKMQIYTGKPSGGAPERNQGRRVVLQMSEGLQGHCITCDNFFTSYNLGAELLKRKLTLIGTVKKTLANQRDSEHGGQRRAFVKICFLWKCNSSFLLPQKKQECPCDEYNAQRCITECKWGPVARNDTGL